jgi:hypothetical protein
VGGSPEVPSVSARPNRDLVCQAAAWHACFDLSMHASSVAVHWRLAGHASGMLTSSIHTCRERVLLCSGVEGCTTRPTFADIGKEAACCCEHKQEGTVDVRSCRCVHKACRHRGRNGGCTRRPCSPPCARDSMPPPRPICQRRAARRSPLRWSKAQAPDTMNG